MAMMSLRGEEAVFGGPVIGKGRLYTVRWMGPVTGEATFSFQPRRRMSKDGKHGENSLKLRSVGKDVGVLRLRGVFARGAKMPLRLIS